MIVGYYVFELQASFVHSCVMTRSWLVLTARLALHHLMAPLAWEEGRTFRREAATAEAGEILQLCGNGDCFP